jgi:hypothetical protein
MDADDQLVETIAPDVLNAIENRGFYTRLDDQMCPGDPRRPRVLCDGSLALTTATLESCGFGQEDIADVLAVLAARGGFCDCEVLYNVAEESRLKSEYWKAAASKRKPLHGHRTQESCTQRAARFVRLWILIEKDDVGYPESQDWEDLWGEPTSEGGFMIESTPFFAKGIAKRDSVTAVLSDEGFLAVEQIAGRGGHSTFRIWLSDVAAAHADRVVNDLKSLGASVEVALERLLAIDTDPEHESAVWDHLQEGMKEGAWELQVGYSPE